MIARQVGHQVQPSSGPATESTDSGIVQDRRQLQAPGGRLVRAAGGGLSWPPLTVPILIALLVVVLVQAAWIAAMIRQPRELLYSEAIVYDKAARVLRGESLYAPLDQPPYSVTAYPPLYYWSAAAAMALFGPGFGPGRAISALAGLAAAVAVGYLAARGAGNRRAGLVAALLFIVLGLPAVPSWAGLYREHVLAVALSVGALAVLVGGRGRSWLALAGLLVGLAFLTKQLVFGAGLAGFLWLWRRDRPGAVLFAGAGLGPVLLTSALLEQSTDAFLANVLHANVNPFSLTTLRTNLLKLLLFQAGPLILAGLRLRQRGRSRPPEEELLALFWLASLLPLAALVKVGAAQNYWFENAAASSVLATLYLWERGSYTATSPVRRLGSAIPLVPLYQSLAAFTALVVVLALPAFQQLWPRAEEVAALEAVVERVRAEPGDVLANPLDVVVLAGKRLYFEPLIFSILQREGRWDAEPLVCEIRRGSISLLVLDQPLEQELRTADYPAWPAPVLSALRETMVLQGVIGDRYLYVPRWSGSSPGCSPSISAN